MLRLSSLLALVLAGSVSAAYPRIEPKNILPPEGCTSIAVDPHASIDGGMTTHTNDCHECDSRISKVPARDWPEGSTRPIYKYRSAYPRYMGPNRGSTYEVENTDRTFYPWEPTVTVGEIPQVAHTYAYIDGHYGIQNEHQVGIGESTCAARIVALPVFDGGKALLEIQQLSRIALERSRTARQAVITMGELAEQYGFYGAVWRGPMAEGEAGEVLMIADPHEAYTFHILPDSTGTSAIWAAQRIPKGHIAVCANAFFIKEMDFNDKENFLHSKNIIDEAKKNQFWDESYGAFHFTRIFGLVTVFEKYSSRRSWRVLSLAAPSLNLPSNSTIDDLPVSVKAERLLNKTDLMWMQRDHFEGTAYDTTQGLQSGPYGNPTRYDPSAYWNISAPLLYQGRFERTISIHRTIYSFVTTSRSYVPNELSLLWFGSAVPHATFYQPVYITSTTPPPSTTVGSLHGFNRQSSFWAVTTMEGWMEKCYKLTQVEVGKAQIDLEREEEQESKIIEKKVMALLASKKEDDNDNENAPEKIHEKVVNMLTDFTVNNGNRALDRWWNLFESLITKFHDGFRVDNVNVDTIAPQPVFYPFYWLEATGYWGANGQGPDYSQTSWQFLLHPPTVVPNAGPYAASASTSAVDADHTALADVNANGVTSGISVGAVIAICGLVAVIFMSLGLYLGVKLSKKRDYAPIYQYDA